MTRKTMLTPTLIDEICDLVSRGAVDHVVCQIIGIHRSTLWDWKRRGRNPNEREPIFAEFYQRYQQACGFRTLTWIEAVERAGHFKWLLTHSPDTKDDWSSRSVTKILTAATIEQNDVAEYIKAIDNYRKTLRKQNNQT